MKLSRCLHFILELFLMICWNVSMEAKDVIVETKFGKIRGLTRSVRQENGTFRDVHVFLGIPYAQPPVKQFRFKPPQPLTAWQPDVLDARKFKNICPQKDSFYNYIFKSIEKVWPGFSVKDMNEDCLHLNIYTPSKNKKSRLLPVLFYIHGGTYIMGTPARDKTPGHILPLREIILVTIQYRLGPFGFLTTGDSVLPGNNGMLDQIEALKWVKNNIVHFGGDGSQITIAGNSAGASSVGLHIVSPLTQGLFQRAILESGVELSPFAILPLEKAIAKSKYVADRLLCDSKDSKKMVECLRTKDVSDILLYYKPFPGPVIDKYFLPDTPENLRRNGKAKNVSVIMGFMMHDGSHAMGPLKLRLPLNNVYFRKGIERAIQTEMEINDHGLAKRMADALEFQYYPWHKIKDSKALYSNLVKLLTDYFIIGPTFRSANFHSKLAPTYLFHYRHIPPKSKQSWVTHSSNVEFSFGTPFSNATFETFTDEDRNVSDFLITCYANFVKYGNPTPGKVMGVKWISYNVTEGAYMNIKAEPEVAYKFHPSRVAFWDYYVARLSQATVCSSRPPRSHTTPPKELGSTRSPQRGQSASLPQPITNFPEVLGATNSTPRGQSASLPQSITTAALVLSCLLKNYLI